MDGKLPTYEELLDLTRRQARQIDELRAEVERLKAEVEQAKRAGKRQAAPFSKGSPKANPKRPGRKPGHPPSRRPVPSPNQVDRTIDHIVSDAADYLAEIAPHMPIADFVFDFGY